LPSHEWAACTEPLDAATLAAVAAGVSTRRYASTQEPVPAAHRPRAASKSAVSRRFAQLSQEQLTQWLARPIGRLWVIDGGNPLVGLCQRRTLPRGGTVSWLVRAFSSRAGSETVHPFAEPTAN
jgi:hypothetical protein